MFSIRNDITVSALSRYPEVITMEEQQRMKRLWNFIQEAVKEACEGFVKTRITEGELKERPSS